MNIHNPSRAAFLEVDAISRRFGGLKAVSDVTFSVASGEIVSLIGPNGAGKTTLFNLLTGQLAPSGGALRFEGRDIGKLRPHHRARIGFGRTFQISQTLTSMTVLENAMIGAFMKETALGPASDRAGEALRMVGLANAARRRSSELTLGGRRRLEVARALAMEPKIVLLDEVMAGLNQTEVDEIIALVRQLNADGVTFLVIEHNLKVVRAFSQRVLVLNRGQLLAEGTAEHVLANPDVIAAYIGKRAQ